jgi:hypothetical protein
LSAHEGQAQFSLYVPKNLGAALPFNDELALAILKSNLATASPSFGGPDWQYHVTLNCFDGSAHTFLLFYEQRSTKQRALEKDYVSCLSITSRHTGSQPWN